MTLTIIDELMAAWKDWPLGQYDDDSKRALFLKAAAYIESMRDTLRDVRGTLRTDQHEGHQRIARRIDDQLSMLRTREAP